MIFLIKNNKKVNSLEIQYFDREKSNLESEKVYGSKAVEWLYRSRSGKLLVQILIRKPFSFLYGKIQSHPFSASKINPFVKKFNINLSEYLLAPKGSSKHPYPSFNDFFIRKFQPKARPIEKQSSLMPAFCEARYFAHQSLSDTTHIPVKGSFWTAKELLNNQNWYPYFQEGPCLLARLCPVDYHRFHFPDQGKILDHYRIPGVLHSVNPLALKFFPQIFSINERQVTILETQNFGKLAYIEVGAICVGKIAQSRQMTGSFKRGEEKGFFLFGGSTVILLGEKGRWSPDPILLEKTQEGIEVFQKLGTRIAHSTSTN